MFVKTLEFKNQKRSNIFGIYFYIKLMKIYKSKQHFKLFFYFQITF